MSWASRRRTTYLGGVILFLAIIVTVPIVHYILSIQPTCFDGVQNEEETAVDEGGPCVKQNPADLSPLSTLWARSFKVRDGSYTAIAYVLNSNQNAGVAQVNYEFGLYDSGNVEVAEATGTTFIMPGVVTPVIQTGISTGNRDAVHTYFQITDEALDWERMKNPAAAMQITNQQISDTDSAPRLSAQVTNTSFATLSGVRFIGVVFDPYGNAIAASATAIASLVPNTPTQITFTWPSAFSSATGRIDITPLLPGVVAQPQS